jgi:uncharacterized lipoprotein YmbA
MKPTIRIAVLCSLLSTLAAGCSSTPRITYYSLGTPAQPAATAETSSVTRTELPSVSVESVTVPELVDRLQLVERTNTSRIEILELHRWAEPLKSSIPRTVADNLSHLLESDRISVYPQNAGSHAAYQVFIDFQRFESEGTAVSVDALWMIRRTTDGGQKSGRTRVHEATGGAGYEAVVSAYNRALTTVSSDIARALRAEWDGAARP